ncbi:proteinase-activated receptor 4 [Syngnathus scovelli]|uniref:proteinase-activated receptor 4 n=1 Tax=Syngnathus scovelli TaxID=161590 RepID=UPI0021100CF9|nr:proteinase-activated receptor 4 [Syngnathus scovelli]
MTWFVAPVWVWLLWSVLAASSWSTPGPTEECSVMSVRLRAFRLKLSCNVTTLNEKQLKEIQAPTTMLYLPALYLLALALGPPANLLALWILAFRAKRLPSTALLLNLTAVDSLLLLALPFRIAYHFRGSHWDLGEAFCRTVTAILYGNMYGSVLCLALVALDRYVALVHPFGAKTLRTRRTSLQMTATVAAAMLPLLMSQQTYTLDQPQITTCHDALPQREQENFFLPYFATLFTLGFLLSSVVIVFCHCGVLLVFVVCVLPSNVLLLLTYAADGEDVYVPYMLSLAVSTFSSCVDPFIFYYVSADFRDKAERALCCQGDRPPPAQPSNKVSSSRAKVALLSISTQKELC